MAMEDASTCRVSRRDATDRPRTPRGGPRARRRAGLLGRSAMTPQHRVLIERICASADVVRRAVDAVSRARFDRPPRDGEWSALETLTHVRDVIVHVYGLRIRRLLYEDAPAFADFDEEGYRRASLARGEAATHLLETIVGEHEQLARLLETLPDAAWSREGRHPSLGAMSIEFLARRIGEHAEEHAAQIAAAGRA
ncbi:MAG: hypothetical protein DMD76_06855 [Candidatus Rokuibacteriota bacterium]|nr:MAG: hypothetical protein DMD76_06855 [Candidatus Rokubacteria bacterium]